MNLQAEPMIFQMLDEGDSGRLSKGGGRVHWGGRHLRDQSVMLN